MAFRQKLVEDLREVPSWVWLGGAAGIGLLWILRGHSASQAAQQAPGNQANPLATGQGVSTLQDYGNYQMLSDIESELQQILKQQQLQSQLPTPGNNNQTYPFLTPGQPINFTPGPLATGYPAYQQPGLGATDWGIGTQGGQLFAYDFSSKTPYQWNNGQWQQWTDQQYTDFVLAHPGSTTWTGYRGPGTYFGQTVSPLPNPSV